MLIELSGQTTQNLEKIVIDWKLSATLELLSALGSLGRRFESCRLDQLKQ